MKDLRYITYFEELLQEANNELVKKAKNEGRIALGYSCYFLPEVIMNLPGCFSTRLRAPNTQETEMGTYYMTNRVCTYSRSILERAVEGGYDYLDALLSAETCPTMYRGHEYFDYLKLVEATNPDFFVTRMPMPNSIDERSAVFYTYQMKNVILDRLAQVYGIDISDEAIMKAIKNHNELCRIITEIGDLRKLDNPPITGYEFHVIQLVSQVCPHDLIVPYLKETLEELKNREIDPKPWYRARIVIAGSEIDDPEFIKLVEDCGALVVADRFCFGSLPGRETIDVQDGEKPLHAIARHYIANGKCPRVMTQSKAKEREDYIEYLYNEYNADGVLIEQMKFCDFWSYEKFFLTQIVAKEREIPMAGIEKEYTLAGAGQIKTRIQAFVESLEIKKLQKNNK